jgi:hypothetical protein
MRLPEPTGIALCPIKDRSTIPISAFTHPTSSERPHAASQCDSKSELSTLTLRTQMNNRSLRKLNALLEIDVQAQRAVSVNGVETQGAEARKHGSWSEPCASVNRYCKPPIENYVH